jgi:hypothetical protein
VQTLQKLVDKNLQIRYNPDCQCIRSGLIHRFSFIKIQDTIKNLITNFCCHFQNKTKDELFQKQLSLSSVLLFLLASYEIGESIGFTPEKYFKKSDAARGRMKTFLIST